MLSLISHPHEEVRRRAVTAVAQNSHPSIRDFIERLSSDETRSGRFVQLFARNFRPGDEEGLAGMVPVEDVHQMHTTFFHLLDVFERNRDANGSRMVLQIYELTPCGGCRLRAAKLLLDRYGAPAWLGDECRFDSEEETRALAGGPSSEELSG